MSALIDHLVYAVPDFDLAISQLTEKLGITPSIGGRHLARGTKNALLNLGNQCYLEILGIDDENLSFEGDRWMGMDMISQPTITRWAIKSSNINRDSEVLRNYREDLGQLSLGERLTADGHLLKWQMTLPSNTPEVDITPFLLDWSASAFHPCERLEHQCALKDIVFYHPHPAVMQTVFTSLDIDHKIIVHTSPKIEISIIGKNGLVVL